MAVAVSRAAQVAWPTRVLVTVTGLTLGDSLQIYRVADGVREELRGGHSDAVTDTSFTVVDAELRYGTYVKYTAVVNGVDEYSNPGSTVAEFVTNPQSAVVSDAITGLVASVVILNWDEKTYDRPSSVFRAGGRNIVVSGALGQFTGAIELFTETAAQHQSLMNALRNATEGIVQLRSWGYANSVNNGDAGFDCYIVPTTVTHRRMSQDGTDPRRITVLQAVEVESWSLDVKARGFTLADIADVYDGLTLADYENDFATLLAAAQANY